MEFAHSIWLIAGLAACTVLGFGFYHFKKRAQAALKKFAAGHLLERLTERVSPGRRMIKRILIVSAVAALFVALAQPRVGFQWKEVKRKGIDILMAVDTSKSMLANDVRPNRLERSKLAIIDFVSKLEGDRVGLIPFAGTAFLMCPLTMDYDAFRQSLDALDTQIIPQGGTDLACAIREAEFSFSNDSNQKILVLVTDGEDLEGEALTAAAEAAQEGMTIYTVGVGTPAGELIPINQRGKGSSFVKDEQGKMVKSRLDEETLRRIAEATGGQYEPLGRQGEGLETIYRQNLSLFEKHELAERMKRIPVERFEWPLLLAFILLIIEFAVSDRKRLKERVPAIKTGGRRFPTRVNKARAALFSALILVFLAGSQVAHASARSAEEAYNRGDYSLAVAEYMTAAKKDPKNAQLRFNLGAAAYKDKKYKEAIKGFQSTLEVQDIAMQNQAYYNTGNTFYRQGQVTEKSNPGETIKRWEESIKAYEGALKLKPDDEEAGFNLEFVKKRLEELKKKQKQDNKKNKNSCKDKNSCTNKNNDQNRDKKQDKDKNKGQNKDQNKDQAENKGKNRGNTGGRKDNKQKNSGQENAKSRPDKGQKGENEKKRSQANRGDKPKEEKNPGEKDPMAAKAQNRSVASRGKRSRPGQMTDEQARRLLDSLKGDERQMPMVAGNEGKARAHKEKKRRDW